MTYSRNHKWYSMVLLILLMTISACAGGKDFAYWSDNEVPQGKGIFSGDDGYFTIYRKTAKPTDPEEKAKAAEESRSANPKAPE